MLKSGLSTWQDLISAIKPVVFLSVNGEEKLCPHTPCRPLLHGDALQTCPQPLAVFVLTIPAWLGRKGFIVAAVGEFLRAPSPACCPSNCYVVRRRVPLKALSDSSKSLASNSDVDPLSTNNSLSRPPWGIAARRV